MKKNTVSVSINTLATFILVVGAIICLVLLVSGLYPFAVPAFLSFLILVFLLKGISEIIRLLHLINYKLGEDPLMETAPPSSNLPSKKSHLHAIVLSDARQIQTLFTRRNEYIKGIYPTPFNDFYFVEADQSFYLVELGDFLPYIIPKERWKPEFLHFFEKHFNR